MVDDKILDAYSFWNSKRVTYNSIVGIFTIFIAFTLAFSRDLGFVLTFVILWTLIGNGLYSLGFEFEGLIIRNSEGRRDFGKYRIILFWTGTIFNVFLTLILGLTLIM